MGIHHYGSKTCCVYLAEDHTGTTVITAEDSKGSDSCPGLVGGSFDMLMPGKFLSLIHI